MNQPVLITGVAGFIGSYLAHFFLNKGFAVRGVDNLSSGTQERVKALQAHPNFEWIQGDITDFEFCKKICAGQQLILHHAAMVSVKQSLEKPLQCHHQNVTGTLYLLEAAREMGVKRFVFPSSAAVYGNATVLPIPESTRLDPQSPYAVSKVIAEYYCKLYSTQYGVETIVLRYFNVFGPNQDADSPYASVIPKFIKSIKAGQSPTIFGDGEQLRDFVYIEQVAQANLAACRVDENYSRDTFNIGSGVPISVNQLYKWSEIFGKTTLNPTYLPERPGEVKDSCADISCAKEILGLDSSPPLESLLKGLF